MMRVIEVRIESDELFTKMFNDVGEEVLEDAGKSDFLRNASSYIVGATFMALNEKDPSITFFENSDGELEFRRGGA